ncbi:MAG: hypothetical protein COA67_12075 [Lutibacter sp.]|nr:MAG: hypothetical protein COA67_12075 [Lutibacter sp.]
MKRANKKKLSTKRMIDSEQHACTERSRSMTIENNKYKHMKTMQSIKQVLKHMQTVLKFSKSNQKLTPNLIYLET